MISTWDVLICTIPHRHKTLLELLSDLDRQWQSGFGALLFYDNLENAYGDKTRVLVEASRADYVSCIDDDDLLAPDGVARVMAALESKPDYVGFPVRWTQDGSPRIPVEHSLRHGGWSDSPEMLKRDITQFNPIRRELALLGEWEGHYEAERRWGDRVRETGLCVTEAWLPDPVYYYRESTNDTFVTGRQSLPLEQVPPLPSYPWLRSLP
jgi:glycosyltransferase involved in cell wall biosynthesis